MLYVTCDCSADSAVCLWSTCVSDSAASSTPSSPPTQTEPSHWLPWWCTAADQSQAAACACCCRRPAASRCPTPWTTATGSLGPAHPAWAPSGGHGEEKHKENESHNMLNCTETLQSVCGGFKVLPEGSARWSSRPPLSPWGVALVKPSELSIGQIFRL